MQNGRRVIWCLLGVSALFLVSSAIDTKQPPEKKEVASLDKQLSMLFGYHMWQQITAPDYPFKVNVDDVIEGIRAAATGEGLPSDSSEENLWQKIHELQAARFEESCVKNLEAAERYLSKIALLPNIKTLVPGKLYYEVIQEGNENTIESKDDNLFIYKITTLDGIVVVDAKGEVALANAIPGFAKGVEGMKAGEKRKLYIHPDLAYRKIGGVVPPQMLLMIEVEA